jgi:predicted O-methyltransferase YrrM/prolipoprotein diacylglyceryltransferase
MSPSTNDVNIFIALTAAGVFVTGWLLQVDLGRRKMRANGYVVAVIAFIAGFVCRFPEASAGLRWSGGFAGEILAIVILAWFRKIPVLKFLDAFSPAAAAGFAVGQLAFVISDAMNWSAHPNKGVLVTKLLWFVVWVLIAAFLWRMGTMTTLGPKATGEIFCLYLLFAGGSRFVFGLARVRPGTYFDLSKTQIESLVVFLVGGILLWWTLARYHKVAREHRILQHVTERGDILQPEYSRATPECPHPERWRMYDAMAAEVEVLDFLKTLVTTIKPELVVETGTFLGSSTLRIAEGLSENGFGRVITCEADPRVFEEARKRIVASGLAEWIELRNESSLEMKVEGRIDLLYCDSDLPLREQEVRWFLPQVNRDGLILMHDASSALKTVREGALNLEREGLVSVVFLPTPRGLVVAQKREGRT